MTDLTKDQIAALNDLGEPWHYRVNWRPKLSQKDYDDLLNREYIAEVWTWASGTRPDVGITDLGAKARTAFAVPS